ncbi:MAG: hypothetical protein IPI81_06240 [Flavobacteriales bacterium]|nr:hypothetical protein [Flavobacteriales bacterium]MCC6937225.1 hypothetical protein [Flavobacteriales bacterium]
MRTRTAFSLLLIGTAIVTGGSLFKVLHWPSANIQLLLGAMLQVAALLVLAYRSMRSTHLKDLLTQ